MIKGVNAQAVQDTPDDQIDAIYKELRESFNTDRTLSLSFRKTMLSSLKRGIKKYETELLAALNSDLGNSSIEGYLANVLILYKEIDNAMKNLSDWSKVQKRKTPMAFYPGKSYVKPQARGVVLVIGSWNYPFNTLAPAISAIAAGNAVLMKPSEHSPACSKVFKKLCDEFLDTRFYRVIEGGIPTGTKVTGLPTDLICFTGSTYVGKIIARAASANLTPCILELGGKCPTIIDHTANLDVAARRVVSTKFMNAG